MSLESQLQAARAYRYLLRIAERQADKDRHERSELTRLQIEIEEAKRRLAKKTEHRLDVEV